MATIDASSRSRTMELWLLPFAAMFTQPSWLNAVALASGALLCLNRRTVCAALVTAQPTPWKKSAFESMSYETHAICGS